jgi:hypothetical protein
MINIFYQKTAEKDLSKSNRSLKCPLIKMLSGSYFFIGSDWDLLKCRSTSQERGFVYSVRIFQVQVQIILFREVYAHLHILTFEICQEKVRPTLLKS